MVNLLGNQRKIFKHSLNWYFRVVSAFENTQHGRHNGLQISIHKCMENLESLRITEHKAQTEVKGKKYSRINLLCI